MFKIGDSVRLLTPHKGYSTGTLVCYHFPYWTVKLSSGLEISCYEDEFRK